jgi:CPA2 family monovalent cation:H+ antiporter-2
LGYIVAGFIIGPHTPHIPLIVKDLPNIQVWGELGVIFVMFSLGLDFSFHKLVRVGSSASSTAACEVLFMLLLGYGAGKFLGWGLVDCFFLGGMLAISSTTIIFKAFDEFKLRSRYFAEQVFGILIVEDLAAVLLLVGLSIVAMTQTLWDIALLFAAARLILVVGGWFLVGYFLIPTFLRRAGRLLDNETMTIVATGLCLLMVAAASHLGYSAALGAFIMGSILAETREAERIEHLIRPLRDLFAAVFFVSVGMLVNPQVISQNAATIGFLTAVLISGKIFGVTLSALASGQTLRTSVQIGFSLAQIGEFSFIIATLGSQLGVTSDFLYPIAVAVSGISTFTTPYLIRLSEPFAAFLERTLPAGMRNTISRYSNWMQSPSEVSDRGRSFFINLFRFFLNGILVTLIFVGMGQMAVPFFRGLYPDLRAVLALCWLGTILVGAPFVWGMFFSFRDPTQEENSRAVVTVQSFAAHLFTVLWVGLLSAAFFTTFTGFVFTLCAGLFLFLLFYRRLGNAYRWFESQLVSNLRDSNGAQHAEDLNSLVPWDLHLSRALVHANSALTGKTLAEAAIRQRFGLNIVAIQRGKRTIAAPEALEKLFPGDCVLVLGTDAQVDDFKLAIEASALSDEAEKNLSDYSLIRLLIDKESAYLGKPIRESRIRDSHNALIVGLERGNMRTTNPDPNRILAEGDVLWLATDLPNS